MKKYERINLSFDPENEKHMELYRMLANSKNKTNLLCSMCLDREQKSDSELATKEDLKKMKDELIKELKGNILTREYEEDSITDDYMELLGI